MFFHGFAYGLKVDSRITLLSARLFYGAGNGWSRFYPDINKNKCDVDVEQKAIADLFYCLVGHGNMHGCPGFVQV
jgi:hypothetical protein